MAKPEKKFTSPQRCDHCGNSAPMEILAEYSGVKSYDNFPNSGVNWECGTVYELLSCPACKAVTLRSYYWHDNMEPSEVEFKTLYPGRQDGPLGLPISIKRAHDAAQKVRNIDANAYGVLLGRLLELICVDRSANGKTLNQRLEDLGDKGEIPSKLVGVAKGLKNLRNIGAHATLGELTPAEVPILDNLCRAILEYVYSAPFLAQEAEDRLQKLKNATQPRA